MSMAQEGLASLCRQLNDEATAAAAVAELDARATAMGPVLLADLWQLPVGLVDAWRRRVATWHRHTPSTPEEAVLAERARTQAQALTRIVPGPSTSTSSGRWRTALSTWPDDAVAWPTTGAAARTEIGRWGDVADVGRWVDGPAPAQAIAGEVLEAAWGIGHQGPFPGDPTRDPCRPVDTVREGIMRREQAWREWLAHGRPVEDWEAYRAPVPPLPSAAPANGKLARPAAGLAKLARRAGGLPFPLLLPYPSPVVAQAEAAAWRESAVRMPEGLVGLPLYLGAEDPWLHWNSWGHPGGLIVAAIVPPEGVLHVGHPDHREDHGRFWRQHHAVLGNGAEGPEAAQALRQAFLAEGIVAIARYDLRAVAGSPPQEVWLLRSAPPVLHVLRESLSP